MAFDVNEVTVLGRLGQDPEVKSFQNGGQICNLRIATSESWKDRQTGEKQDRTEWHSVTLRTDFLIRYAGEHLRKGSRVYVRGKLQTRKWQDKNGNDRYTTEIVVAGYEGRLLGLDTKPGQGSSQQRDGRSDGTAASGSQRYGGGHQSDAGAQSGWNDDLDDDIPF